MAGLFSIIVPEAATNLVLNPSAEADGNFGVLMGSPSQSPSASGSASASRSLSPSGSASISPSASKSPSASASISPSGSASPSSSASRSVSASASPSSSVSVSPSPSAGFTTVTRVTTYARAGDYCYAITPGSTNDGATFTVSALANAIHYVTFYARGNAAATLEASLDGLNYNAAAAIGGATGGWVRYGVSIVAAQASGSVILFIRNTADEDFYLDCLQVEQAAYATTYLDGDAGPLFRWNGLRHGSTSTRDAQERAGGRERNLADDYSIEVVEGSSRLGMPPLRHNLQPLALQPGAVYQNTKVLPREIQLKFMFEGTGATQALAYASFHSLRQDLIDLLKPDLVRGAQPVVIGYAGADSGTKLWAAFYYAGGLEFGDFLGVGETPTVKLLAPDPFWYEDNRETATLDFSDSVANANYAVARLNGAWSALSSGFNGAVFHIVVDRQRGRIYYAGNFSTAGGVAAARICYWNGTTFVAMDSGASANVFVMALAPNGDLWVGGEFTTIGSAALPTKGLARWNVATNTWTNFNLSATVTDVRAIAISSTGTVYFGGQFTNWTTAAADYVAQTTDNGATFLALGSSPYSASNFPSFNQAMVIDGAGNLWVGEFFSGSGTASLRKWDGSTWTTVVTTNNQSNPDLTALAFAENGDLFIAGTFSSLGGVTAANIARYNGVSVYALGSGLGSGANTLCPVSDGLLVGGQFNTAGGITIAGNLAFWNDTTWTHVDVDVPSSVVYAIAANNRDLYLGMGDAGTATASGRTTVTSSGTASVFPDVTLFGPMASTATLAWLENQTTDEKLYFDLVFNAGEQISISFQPGDKSVRTLWGARPGTRIRYGQWYFEKYAHAVFVSWAHAATARISNQPLANSDFAAWHLQPGANTIAAFITGNNTSGVQMLMHWEPRHWSVDGAA